MRQASFHTRVYSGARDSRPGMELRRGDALGDARSSEMVLAPAELRARRHLLRLTQAELGNLLGVTANTLARWERGEKAIGHPERVCLALERLEGLEHRGRFLPIRIGPNEKRHNLPSELSSFVGREQDTADLVRLIGTTRLLILTGVGGVGKTRLALRVVAAVLPAYADGVWFVGLAALADAALVPRAVAEVLGLREQPTRPVLDTLVDALQSRHLLLVLDNCEHLVTVCGELADTLLRACPNLVILATSREPLAVPGEHIWPVPPLSLPELEHLPSAERVAEFAAVRLFVDRAVAISPGFRLSEANVDAVAQVCARLDGIPLAIELAAARVKMLAPHQIAARIADRFGLLTGGSSRLPARHQTLRATLAWSYELLTSGEQRLFDRLSVFAGSWTLEAAAAVCVAAWAEVGEVLDQLGRLVDKSLVLVDPDGGGAVRYRLLETVRQYGSQQLDARGELDVTHYRHAAFFLELAEQTELEQWGPRAGEWQHRLEDELDNLRSAARWLIEQADAQAGQRLGGALWRLWLTGGRIGEGRAWLTELLALPGGDQRTLARAKVLIGAGHMAAHQGDYPAAQRALEEGLATCRELGDHGAMTLALYHLAELAWWQGNYAAARSFAEEGVAISQAARPPAEDAIGLDILRSHGARSLYVLGGVAYDEGDYDTAEATAKQALGLFATVGYPRGVAMALKVLGRVSWQRGDLATARSQLQDSVARFRATGHSFGAAWALMSLGWVATDQGDHVWARAVFAESLAEHYAMRARARVLESLEGFAQLAVAEGQPERALRLAGAAAGQRAVLGTPLSPTERGQLDPRIERARRTLGPIATTRAWEAGQAMSLEFAIAEALDPAPPARLRHTGRGARNSGLVLTPRQCEVATLVARGCTNREMARQLVITERTAETHLERIFTKLDLHSRSQLACWVLEHGLLGARSG
jgi:predicted ATPase/DNA-binding CsgD family transcriptional regulator/DNA-binding transcriptional regulator YiaG